MTYLDSSDMIKNPHLDDDQLHLCHKPVSKSTDAYGIPNDDNYLYSASSNDMTGLTPTVAHNEYEAQSYEELFPYLPQNPASDTAVSEGIHAEYRTQVTKQDKHNG